jgi:hypothetical protein
VAVDYQLGEPTARYLGQPNYNAHSKLPGPLWTLFCYLGLRAAGTIEGVVVLSILLNTVAIYLTYLLAQRTVGDAEALWASLFAATLPSAVFYSVGVYNPEVMPFLGACLYLALWAVLTCEGSRHSFWIGFVLLMMPQFHMSGLALWPAVCVLLALAPVHLNWRWLAAGLVAGLLLYVPYLLGDSAHGWTNTRGMFSGDKGWSWDCLKAFSTPFNLIINWVPQWTRSTAEYRQVGRACFGAFGVLLVVNLLSVMIAGALALGAFRSVRAVALGFWRAPRAVFARAPGPVFLATLLAVPLFLAALSGKPFHARYALVLFPALLALCGAGAVRWLASPRFRRPVLSALVISAGANIWFMPAFYWHQGQVITRGDIFVPSFRQLETVYRALKAHAGGQKRLRVDDTFYLEGLAQTEQRRRDAGLLRSYVALRERESGGRTDLRGGWASYRLCREEEVSVNDARVAFRAQGIALVAESDDAVRRGTE